MRSLRLLLATETEALRWLVVRVLCDDQPLFVVGSGHLAFDGWPGCLLQGPPSWYFAEQIGFRVCVISFISLCDVFSSQ